MRHFDFELAFKSPFPVTCSKLEIWAWPSAMHRRNLHGVFNALFGLGWFLNAIFFPVVLKIQPNDLAPFMRQPMVSLQGRVWWLWSFAFIITILVKTADKRICDRWGYDAVKEMLDILRERGFPESEDPVHYHRVTLFRHKKWRLCWRMWPWSGWLVPVVRSGHTTLNHRTCFLAPDDADKVEGVAGRCWSTKGVVLVPDENSKDPLPDLHDEPAKPRDPYGPSCDYAKATFVCIDWVIRKMPHSRSFLGIPVVVKGEPWGVVIVDSRGPEIKMANQILDTYNEIARPFIKCLERLP